MAQDYRGEFYAGLNKLCWKVSSVEATWPLARFEAIKFAIETTSRDIMLEGNNPAINAIRSDEDGLCWIMSSIRHIAELYYRLEG